VEGWYRLSADKGFQADVGADAVLLGEIHNTDAGCTGVWGLGSLENRTSPFQVSAGADGSVWLFFGEESAFEGPHELYFTSFEAVFEPS
jgi:hypothetical protein